MDDNIVIKSRKYTKYTSEVIQGLQQYLINPELELVATRTGVTIDDDEMITINANYRTYVTFRVDKDMFVKKVTISSGTFVGPFAIFYPKYQKTIINFFYSFIGRPISLTK